NHTRFGACSWDSGQVGYSTQQSPATGARLQKLRPSTRTAMTQIIDTPPSPVDQRRNATLIAVIIGGVFASLAGIGVMVYALALYLGESANLSSNQTTGCLLIAIAGF